MTTARTNTFPTHFANGERLVYVLQDRRVYHSGDDCCDTLEKCQHFEGITEKEAIRQGLHRCASSLRGGFDAAQP
jgi:hypothetical protein